jgi:3',5'-cyclic AMP phosphodiesterase CpdA
MATSLLKSLPAFQPDLIAVTGDLADSPRSRYYRSALLFLRELQNALARADGTKPQLIVIPGNHDYKPFGVIPLLLSMRFHVYFGLWADRRDPLKLKDRLARYASLLNAWRERLFDQRPWNTGNRVYPLCVTGAGAVIVGYDSNWTRFLATGRIEASEIRDTPAVLLPHITVDPSALRIALLHHHPLPIPYSDHPGITDMEAFLVMQNSGTFMHQMVENDFDIILHGHKHFNCFSRISYQNGTDHLSQIAVLGAGTATKEGGITKAKTLST